MTVLEQNAQQVYFGNGVTTFFEFTADLLEDSIVVVYVDSELVTNYTLQFNGILFATAPADGARIRITRETEITQLRDWTPFGPFPAAKTEDAMDKLIYLKDEAFEFRRFMNLAVARDIGEVTLLNDKGTDAITPLWHHTVEESGMTSGIVSEQTPLEFTPTDTPESYWWIMFGEEAPPGETETSIIASRSGPNGQLSTEMNFSDEGGGGRNQEFARTNPFNAIQEDNFFFFHTWRWNDDDPGPVWHNSMFNVTLERRAGNNQFYMGVQLRDINDTQLIQGTFEYGAINIPGQGLANYGDWLTMACSIKNIQTNDPNRVTAWFWNYTQQTEQDFSGDFVSMVAGSFGMKHPSERGVTSRTGFLNLQDSNPYDGQFGYDGPVAAHGFAFAELDLQVEANRDKIATLAGLSDHGVGGVNIFGPKMAYYTQGPPNLQTGWMNIGDPVLNVPYAFSTGVNRPPYNYATYDHPLGDWVYDTMAAADASGDAWQNGDLIYITQGFAVLRYDSTLAASGHNGLIHQLPFWDETTKYNTITLQDSEAEGAHPDTWSFTDNSTGTKGVDYDLIVDGGLATLQKLTTGGSVNFVSNDLTVAGDEIRFAVYDKISISDVDNFAGSYIATTTGDGSGTGVAMVHISAQNGASPTPPSSAWAARYGANLWENILVPWSEINRFWVYASPTKQAIWTDIGPLYISDDPRAPGSGNVSRIQILVGGAGETELTELKMGYWITGKMA